MIRIVNDSVVGKKIKEVIIQVLATISPIFKEFPFFMNEDFTLVDCYLAPIMWRLTSMV